MSHYIATGVLRNKFVEIISINEGIALVQFTDQSQGEIAYTEIEGVWATAQVLDNFDELAKAFSPEGVKGMIEVMTQTPEWADRVARLWGNLY